MKTIQIQQTIASIFGTNTNTDISVSQWKGSTYLDIYTEPQDTVWKTATMNAHTREQVIKILRATGITQDIKWSQKDYDLCEIQLG